MRSIALRYVWSLSHRGPALKIEPRFLARHLHEAATEQTCFALVEAGYHVERSRGRGYRPDVVARRGDELLAVEVKVLGQRTGGKLANASRWAREHDAQLRLVLVRPQREVGIQVEKIEELVADALRAGGNDFPAALIGTRIDGVEDVEADAITLRGAEGEISGSAFARLEQSSQPGEGTTNHRVLALTFTIWFDPTERRLTRPARITWDLSDLDDDA